MILARTFGVRKGKNKGEKWVKVELGGGKWSRYKTCKYRGLLMRQVRVIGGGIELAKGLKVGVSGEIIAKSNRKD